MSKSLINLITKNVINRRQKDKLSIANGSDTLNKRFTCKYV